MLRSSDKQRVRLRDVSAIRPPAEDTLWRFQCLLLHSVTCRLWQKVKESCWPSKMSPLHSKKCIPTPGIHRNPCWLSCLHIVTCVVITAKSSVLCLDYLCTSPHPNLWAASALEV